MGLFRIFRYLVCANDRDTMIKRKISKVPWLKHEDSWLQNGQIIVNAPSKFVGHFGDFCCCQQDMTGSSLLLLLLGFCYSKSLGRIRKDCMYVEEDVEPCDYNRCECWTLVEMDFAIVRIQSKLFLVGHHWLKSVLANPLLPQYFNVTLWIEHMGILYQYFNFDIWNTSFSL